MESDNKIIRKDPATCMKKKNCLFNCDSWNIISDYGVLDKVPIDIKMIDQAMSGD